MSFQIGGLKYLVKIHGHAYTKVVFKSHELNFFAAYFLLDVNKTVLVFCTICYIQCRVYECRSCHSSTVSEIMQVDHGQAKFKYILGRLTIKL